MSSITDSSNIMDASSITDTSSNNGTSFSSSSLNEFPTMPPILFLDPNNGDGHDHDDTMNDAYDDVDRELDEVICRLSLQSKNKLKSSVHATPTNNNNKNATNASDDDDTQPIPLTMKNEDGEEEQEYDYECGSDEEFSNWLLPPRAPTTDKRSIHDVDENEDDEITVSSKRFRPTTMFPVAEVIVISDDDDSVSQYLNDDGNLYDDDSSTNDGDDSDCEQQRGGRRMSCYAPWDTVCI